jgi:phosphopantetheine adenylyltransferase
MSAKKLKYILSFYLFIFYTSAYAVSATDLMLKSFSFQCPQVITKDVGASLQNLQAVGSIIEEIKTDASCGNTNQMSISLERYKFLFEDFQAKDLDTQNKLELEKKISQYIQFIADPSISDSDKVYMKQELLLAQASLVDTNSKLKRFNSFSGREAKAANQLVQSVDQFLGQLNSKSACLENRGPKIASLLSNVLITTAAFTNPGTALALASSGVIVNVTGQFLSEKRFNAPINEIENSQMPVALRCFSQVMTDQYCSMEDTSIVLQKRKEDIENGTNSSMSLDVLNLLTYQLNGLVKWFNLVYSGADISSEGDLVTREKPIEKAQLLKKILRYTETFGTLRMKTFNQIKNDKERSMAIAIGIESLVFIMDNPSLEPMSVFTQSNNPIFALRSKELLPFEIFKPGAFTTVPICDGAPCSLSKFIAAEGILLSMTEWNNAVSNSKVIIKDFIDQANFEISKTNLSDSYSVLVNAKRVVKGEINAYQGLQKVNSTARNVLEKLKTYGCKESPADCENSLNPYYPQYKNTQKTIDLTSTILKILDESFQSTIDDNSTLKKECKISSTEMNVLSDELKSFKVISCISKMLKLEERGVEFYLAKIRDLVSYDLELRAKYNELGTISDTIATTTRNDLVQSILNSYNTQETNTSINDILLGIEVAKNNFEDLSLLVANYFDDDLKTALTRPNLGTLEKNDLCMRSIIYLNEKNQKMLKAIFNVCKDVKLQHYSKGPTLSFDQFIEAKQTGNFLSRKLEYKFKTDKKSAWCAYRSFSRKNRIIDDRFISQEQVNLNKGFISSRSKRFLNFKR